MGHRRAPAAPTRPCTVSCGRPSARRELSNSRGHGYGPALTDVHGPHTVKKAAFSRACAVKRTTCSASGTHHIRLRRPTSLLSSSSASTSTSAPASTSAASASASMCARATSASRQCHSSGFPLPPHPRIPEVLRPHVRPPAGCQRVCATRRPAFSFGETPHRTQPPAQFKQASTRACKYSQLRFEKLLTHCAGAGWCRSPKTMIHGHILKLCDVQGCAVAPRSGGHWP